MSGAVVDDVFDALSDAQRRRLLIALLEHDPQNVEEMSGVPWEVSESERDLVKKRHVHLPKLEDYGFVEWDRDADVVVKGRRFDEIRPLLEFLKTNHTEPAFH